MYQTKERRFLEILFFGLVLLVFLQLISDFIEAIYANCLLTTGLNETIAAVVFILTPLLLVLAGKNLPALLAVFLGELAVICRMVEVSASPDFRIIVAGCGVGLFLLFLPAVLNNVKRSLRDTRGSILGLGLALAVLLLILLKSVNASIDITGFGQKTWIGWFIAVLTALLMPVILLSGENPPESSARRIFGKKDKVPGIFAPAWGIFSVLILVYFLFGSPVILTRLSGGSYIMIIAVQALATAVFAINCLFNPNIRPTVPKPVLIIWNLVFVVILSVFIFRLQVDFPMEPDAFPLYAPEQTTIDSILLYLVLALYPVIFMNMAVLSGQIINTDLSIRRVGLGFFFAALIFLILVFAHIFTTVYDYIPVVGPFFRDKYWMVHLLAGVGLLVPVILSREELIENRGIKFSKRDRLLLTILLGGIICFSLIGIKGLLPDTGSVSSRNGLKIMTYNIQQGYSEQGIKNYDGQLELIRQQDPDILGMQETDSLRIAGGNSDLARYYADQLNMYAYNGPSPVTGTFGIVLLSRYPIRNPGTFFMYSVGEQTATIKAEIEKEGQVFNVYVTHLGNDGDLVQQEAILKEVKGKENVILIGDFNFKPDTQQYSITTEVLSDSWLKKWPSGEDDNGINPEVHGYGRIDHIFLSPELKVFDSRFLHSHHSDHPALVSEIEF